MSAQVGTKAVDLPEQDPIVVVDNDVFCAVGGWDSLVVKKPLKPANVLLKLKIQIPYRVLIISEV